MHIRIFTPIMLVNLGIYASTGQNTYARLHNLHNIEDDEAQLFSIETHNMPDSAPSLVAYKLNLTGPAVAVQNACCSSLTTVHMACQALRDGDCDIALAAAAHIQYPQQKGYVHQEGKTPVVHESILFHTQNH